MQFREDGIDKRPQSSDLSAMISAKPHIESSRGYDFAILITRKSFELQTEFWRHAIYSLKGKKKKLVRVSQKRWIYLHARPLCIYIPLNCPETGHVSSIIFRYFLTSSTVTITTPPDPGSGNRFSNKYRFIL